MEWLKAFGPAFEAAGSYQWEGSTSAQAWEFLKRAVVRRQHEALLTILTMVDGGHGHFGVTFLRPAYEELIWLAYLNKHSSLANKLINLIAQRDVLTSMRAQNDYLGPIARGKASTQVRVWFR